MNLHTHNNDQFENIVSVFANYYSFYIKIPIK